MLRTTVVAVFFVWTWCVFAEEPSSPEKEKLEIAVWRVPANSFLDMTVPSGSSDEPLERLPGFRSDQPADHARYDAKEFLEEFGIPFPEGSEAIFDAASGTLIVRNTKDNLDLIENMGCPSGMPPSNIAIEISTYECKLPAEYSSSSAPWPSYFQLVKAGVDFQLLDRVSAITKSGIRAALNHIVSTTGPPSPSPTAKTGTPSFREGEYGTIAECETVLGPDNETIDTVVNYRFRQGGADNKPSEVALNTSFTTQDGYPVILSVSPAPDGAGKFNIAVANIRTSNYRDWGLRKSSNGATDKASQNDP